MASRHALGVIATQDLPAGRTLTDKALPPIEISPQNLRAGYR
jgi:hypothetical protein